ncbi:MAG: DUF547 domain-containing protein [Pseudomonadota bacterium]
MLRMISVFLIAAFLPTLALANWTSSAPKAIAGWEAHNPGKSQAIDHSTWDRLLKKYIRRDSRGLNRFAYSRVSAADKAALDAYIQSLSRISITQRSRAVQKAYWLNLYNAVTVDLILDNYPVNSIRDIKSGLVSIGPWKKKLVKVQGVDLTLDNIEHNILRPIWQDPRIHYGVNCASVGCPNLHTQAFTGRNTDKLLDSLARDYVNSPRGLSISSSGRVTVSKIYKWFAFDFGNSEQNVIAHLSRYATPERRAALANVSRISNTRYDWALNE